ncbi:MAG: FAD-dependent oxidoreductase, partial [Tagaea sp.]
MTAFDIGVIGAGSAGLSLAAGASQLGLKVALFEAHAMGGDCLNYGCVPSKALIAAAHAAHA